MSFFDNILRSRNITWSHDVPLWSLRLNNDEFYELKETLKQGAQCREFLSLQREAMQNGGEENFVVVMPVQETSATHFSETLD